MTDYKAIVEGVKVVSTNIDNAEGEGQIWFNSTTGEFKDILNVSAWSTGAYKIYKDHMGLVLDSRFTVGGGLLVL